MGPSGGDRGRRARAGSGGKWGAGLLTGHKLHPDVPGEGHDAVMDDVQEADLVELLTQQEEKLQREPSTIENQREPSTMNQSEHCTRVRV